MEHSLVCKVEDLLFCRICLRQNQ